MVGYSASGSAPVVPSLAAGTAVAAEPGHAPRLRLGARWSPEALLNLAKWSAAQIGRLEQVRQPVNGERWYECLDRTADYELWVIRWPQDTGLVLHDHGGSAGAFYVTEGVLEETSTAPPRRRLRNRSLLTQEGKSFGPDYVHSVTNPRVAPATSVHAYSPPLSSMTFYGLSSTGLVVSHVAREWEGAP